MSKNPERLFSVAEAQQGYFTTAQAVACGYPTSNHVYHLKASSWKRVHRGIYRLARFPTSNDEQYALWSLWSRNRKGMPQGVYSHHTALSLFDLSDIMPTRLHMTVPPDFRRSAPIPKVLILHKDKPNTKDIEERQGYRVTRPLKAISDLLDDPSVSRDHLRQALREGVSRGLITRIEMDRHPHRAALHELLGRGAR